MVAPTGSACTRVRQLMMEVKVDKSALLCTVLGNGTVLVGDPKIQLICGSWHDNAEIDADHLGV